MSRGSTDKCYCGGQVGHRRPDCPRRKENCSLCGKRGHLSHVCRYSGGNAKARAVEVEPAEPEEEREIQHVWALSVCDISGLPLDTLSVCDNFDFPSDGSGNLLNMIMDPGAEEHVVSLADWKSLGEPVLKPAQLRLRSATGDDMGVSRSFMVRGWYDNPMVEPTALGGDSRYQVSVLGDEAGECWLQHRDEADSICFASQWRRLHTASTLR